MRVVLYFYSPTCSHGVYRHCTRLSIRLEDKEAFTWDKVNAVHQLEFVTEPCDAKVAEYAKTFQTRVVSLSRSVQSPKARPTFIIEQILPFRRLHAQE